MKKIGLHAGVPLAEYLAADAVNFHSLKAFEKSAAHAQAELTTPDNQTPAMLVGSAFHTAILEPNDFTSRFCMAPEIKGKRADKRTKAGKAAWAAHDVENESKDTITRVEYESALRAQAAVWAHPVAREILGGAGVNECAAVWKDEATGELCKVRPDRFTSFGGWSTIVDLKKTQDAQRWRFELDAAKYRYHVQAAMYLEGLKALDDADRRHIIIAIEEKRPHGIGIFEFDDAALDSGRVDFRSYLTQYAKAKATGVWPNYEPAVQPISIPKYLRR